MTADRGPKVNLTHELGRPIVGVAAMSAGGQQDEAFATARETMEALFNTGVGQLPHHLLAAFAPPRCREDSVAV